MISQENPPTTHALMFYYYTSWLPRTRSQPHLDCDMAALQSVPDTYSGIINFNLGSVFGFGFGVDTSVIWS
jgi:hypothetical protein